MTGNFTGSANLGFSNGSPLQAASQRQQQPTATIRHRQFSGPMQNTDNQIAGQVQNMSNSLGHGVSSSRTIPNSGVNLSSSGMMASNALMISRASSTTTSQNLNQNNLQNAASIQISSGSNYIQVPSNQLPPSIQQHRHQLQPNQQQVNPQQQQPQISPQQHPPNSNGGVGGGQSLLQQLLSE